MSIAMRLLIPIWDVTYLYIAMGIFAFSTIILMWKRKKNTRAQNVLLALLITFLFLCYALTVLSRHPKPHITYEPYPFWSYYEIIVHHDMSLFWEDVLNIALLVPAGFLFAASHHQVRAKEVIVFAVLVELVIELSQLFLRRGLAEWDDVIHGVIGALIGYGIYVVVRKVCNIGRKIGKQ